MQKTMKIREGVQSKICHKILDLLDQKPAHERSNQDYIPLPVNERLLPELFDPPNAYDDARCWEQVEMLESDNNGIIKIKYKKKRTVGPRYEGGATLLFYLENELALRNSLNRVPVECPASNLVQKSNMLSERIKRILVKKDVMRSLNIQEAEKLLERIGIQSSRILFPKEFNSRCFWGDSKFIKEFEETDFPNLLPDPVILHVHSHCEQPEKILFVENQTTFLRLAMTSELRNYLLVYSSGYKGSAKRIREQNGSFICYSENCKMSVEGKNAFKSWLLRDQDIYPYVYFWGDLDYSGIDIFYNLGKVFPGIELWKPGYDPMVMLLEEKYGHSASLAGKEEQKDPGNSEVAYANHLLEKIRTTELFLDQESVEPLYHGK